MTLRADDAFYTTSLAGDPVAGALGLVQELRALLARSSGAVRAAGLLDEQGLPVRGGLLCERIFGPLQPLQCRCGRLSGPASRGLTCERCGVACDDPSLRCTRWGHLEVPGSVLHPALVPVVAELVGLPEDALCALVLGSERRSPGDPLEPTLGPGALAPLLAAARGPLADALQAAGLPPGDLLLGAIPVSPPLLRGDSVLDGAVHMPGPLTARLQVVVGYALRQQLRVEIGEPVDPDEQAALQAAFWGAFADRRAEPRRWDGVELRPANLYAWPAMPVSPPRLAPDDVEAMSNPPAPERVDAAFAGPDAVLIALGARLWRVSLADGRAGDGLALPAGLLPIDTRGGPAHLQTIGARLLLDPQTGAVSVPDGPDSARLEAMTRDLPELRRTDAARPLPLFDLGSSGQEEAYAAEGEHLWVEDQERWGGVWRLETGLRQIDAPRLCPEPEDPWSPVRALSWDRARGFRALLGRELFQGGVRVAKLPKSPLAAAFSAGGERLLLVFEGRWQVRDADARWREVASGKLPTRAPA